MLMHDTLKRRSKVIYWSLSRYTSVFPFYVIPMPILIHQFNSYKNWLLNIFSIYMGSQLDLKVKGQPRIIGWIHLVTNALYTVWISLSLALKKKVLKLFLPYRGIAATLVNRPEASEQTFVFTISNRLNVKTVIIGPVALKQQSINEGRRRQRTYHIRPPNAFGLGEAKKVAEPLDAFQTWHH